MLQENPQDKKPILRFLVQFPSQIETLMELGKEEAEFTRNDVPLCFDRRCISLTNGLGWQHLWLNSTSLSPLVIVRVLKEMSLHIGRLSIDLDHSSDAYVVEIEMIVDGIDLDYKASFPYLPSDERDCKYVWGELNCFLGRCPCLQCLKRCRRASVG